MLTAKRALAAVYSWPQKTRVSAGRRRSLSREAHIIGAVPSNMRPQPSENSVSPQKRARAAEMEGDMALGMPGDEQDLRLGIPEPEAPALVDSDVDSGDPGPVRR